MKNKLKRLFLTLILSLSLPMMMFLTACGATPSSEVTGIMFDTMTYNEDGIAVFEVDKNVTTDLPYKIFPSSASGYKVYYDPIDKGTAENSSRYTFLDGKITVMASNFEDVRYKVRVGDYSDTCIVRLKEYPVEISTSETNITLNTNDIRAIDIKARFVNSAGVTTIKYINENDFNFLVETSDETIINIPNENRLKFIPVRNTLSNAKVTVTLLNGQGEKTDLKIEINVNIVQNISESFVIMTGSDKFVKNGDSVEVLYSNLEDVEGMRAISFEIYPVNTNNILSVDDNYKIYLSSTKFASLSKDGKKIYINGAVTDSYTLKIKIVYDDLNMEDSSVFAININLKIKK